MLITESYKICVGVTRCYCVVTNDALQVMADKMPLDIQLMLDMRYSREMRALACVISLKRGDVGSELNQTVFLRSKELEV